MIESCSRRRMIIAIALMIGISVIVVIIENRLAPGDHRHRIHPSPSANMTQRDLCWTREQFQEIEECQPCTELQIKSGSPAVCAVASYYQKIKCSETGFVQRRCDTVVWLEERQFWVFEIMMAVIGTISGAMTMLRQRTLDNKILQRIQKQVAAGV